MLKYSATTTIANDIPVSGYLFGAFTPYLDVQNALYELVPMVVGISLAVVFIIITISFGSLLVSIRLMFTIYCTLSITFGLLVLTYQPGPGQDAFAVITPSILKSAGIYW